MNQETYPLLREAYAIIDGIPDDRFNLRTYANSTDPNHCGTIACAVGWLAMHPTFNALGLTLRRGEFGDDDPMPFCPEGYDGFSSVARTLGISYGIAYTIFQCRDYPEYEPEGSELMTDKQLWPITDLDVLVYGVAYNRHKLLETIKLKKFLKRKDKLFKN